MAKMFLILNIFPHAFQACTNNDTNRMELVKTIAPAPPHPTPISNNIAVKRFRMRDLCHLSGGSALISCQHLKAWDRESMKVYGDNAPLGKENYLHGVKSNLGNIRNLP